MYWRPQFTCIHLPLPYAGITQIRFARVGGIRPPSQPGSTELPYVPRHILLLMLRCHYHIAQRIWSWPII